MFVKIDASSHKKDRGGMPLSFYVVQWCSQLARLLKGGEHRICGVSQAKPFQADITHRHRYGRL